MSGIKVTKVHELTGYKRDLNLYGEEFLQIPLLGYMVIDVISVSSLEAVVEALVEKKHARTRKIRYKHFSPYTSYPLLNDFM
jgi:hypothetical protein